MDIIRKVTNSSVLEDIFDIPESMKDKKIVVTISPYEEDEDNINFSKLKGSLSKYKNQDLIIKENDAWANSVVDRYDNS